MFEKDLEKLDKFRDITRPLGSNNINSRKAPPSELEKHFFQIFKANSIVFLGV